MNYNDESPTYESLIVDEGTVEYDLVKQLRNSVGTTSVQGSDSIRTTSVQGSDNVPTRSGQRTDKNQTAVARAAKRPNETHLTVYRENKVIANLLNDRKFISLNTSGTYSSIADLPLSRAPQDLTEAVNGTLRCNVSLDELAKIYTAANVCTRVPRFYVWSIAVSVCVATVFGVNAYNKIAERWGGGDGGAVVLVSGIGVETADTPDVDTIISDFESRKGFTFYPFRKDVIKREIVKSGDYSAANCEIILQQNMAAQIRAVKK